MTDCTAGARQLGQWSSCSYDYADRMLQLHFNWHSSARRGDKAIQTPLYETCECVLLPHYTCTVSCSCLLLYLYVARIQGYLLNACSVTVPPMVCMCMHVLVYGFALPESKHELHLRQLTKSCFYPVAYMASLYTVFLDLLVLQSDLILSSHMIHMWC